MRWSTAILLLSAACALELPPGVECNGVLEAGTQDDLDSQVARAQAGDCVLVAAGSYTSNFELESGVTLVAAVGEPVTLRGGLTLGANNRAIGMSVVGGDVAVLVTGPGVLIRAVELQDATTGVGIICEDAGCAGIVLDQVDVHDCGNGLVANGGDIEIRDSHFQDNDAGTLTTGAGLFVTNGARVSVLDTTVVSNLVGLVADGAATELHLDAVTVRDNANRGVWGQGLRGTLEAPALSVVDSVIAANGVVGLGCVDSRGVRAERSEIVDTVAKMVPVSVSESALIGDGIGLFAGTSAVVVEQVALTGNERAQGLVDDAGTGITFGANTVEGGEHLVVVQNSVEPVTVPAADLSTPAELPVSAPILSP